MNPAIVAAIVVADTPLRAGEAPNGRVGRMEAFNIGCFADRVELIGLSVYSEDEDGRHYHGDLADGVSEEEFWLECREGLSK